MPAEAGANNFLLSRFEGKRQLPLELFGSEKTLFVQQIICVIEDDQDSPGAAETGMRCRTLSYRYALNNEGGKPILRWEYDRSPPRSDYPYPLAHVHVHAKLDDGTELDDLHISTERVPLEQVLWHLLSEEPWGIQPRSGNWQAILEESLSGFAERRSDR